MFRRSLDEFRAAGKEKVVANGGARSARLLTKVDGLEFSLSNVTLGARVEVILWYKNHWEANYIVSGRGAVRDMTTGEKFALAPGIIYTVGPTDRHMILAAEDLRIISVFNPAVVGDEVHGEDGAYPPTSPVPERQERMFVRSADEMRAAGGELMAAGGTTSTICMVLKEDGIGTSISDVDPPAGNSSRLWYKNHWEANNVLSGKGDVTNLVTDEAWDLVPGILHCVGPKDRHSMRADTDIHLLSVFNPTLQGDEIRGQGRELILGGGRTSSVKLVTAAHDMGISMSYNTIGAGIESTLWYKNYWETNYIIAGACDVQDVTMGERWPLPPSALYTMGPRDRHFSRAFEDVILLSVFNPPLAGTEFHDEDADRADP
jgi:L-ectoine synthase